jgi:hypothetical protein
VRLCVRGHLRELVYRDLEDLVAKLYAAMATIDADSLQWLQASFL